MTIYQIDQTTTNAQTSFNLGKEFGRKFSERISQAVDEYRRLLVLRGLSDTDLGNAVEAFSRETRSWAPDLLSEMSGIAEGSGRSREDIIMLNSRTELLGMLRPEGPGECSTAVLIPESGGTPRTVQTWDWLEELSQDLIVRRLRSPEGMEITTFAEFGQVGKIGINNARLGLHFNILYHHSDGDGAGVPVHLVARRILDTSRSVDEAIDIAKSAKVSASTVLTVAAHNDAACIELSPSGVAVLPAEPGDPLIHTNHFIDPVLAAGERRPKGSTTLDRYTCLSDLAGEALQLKTPYEQVQALGENNPAICVAGDPALSWDARYVTRATLVLDFENTTIQYCEGSPADVTRRTWTQFPAVE